LESVFRTSDNGVTWDLMNTGIDATTDHIFSIAADDSVVYAGGNAQYFRSTNYGLTWEQPLFPFISGSGIVRAIACNGPNVVLGIDRTGVYFSSDHGLTWEN